MVCDALVSNICT